jgi:hypothetical protein
MGSSFFQSIPGFKEFSQMISGDNGHLGPNLNNILPGAKGTGLGQAVNQQNNPAQPQNNGSAYAGSAPTLAGANAGYGGTNGYTGTNVGVGNPNYYAVNPYSAAAANATKTTTGS